MTWYDQQAAKLSPDPSYGSNPAEPDISADELKRLCQEYLRRLQVQIRSIILQCCVLLLIGIQ